MKNLAIFFLLAIYNLPLTAQDITSVFLNIPEDILYGIDSERKDKLVANPTDTAEVSVTSALNGNIKRLEMSDDFIALQTSDAGTLQIKLLPLVNDSKIICVVNTICGKACDSYIRFFTTNWNPLENASALFNIPSSDWFIKSDVDKSDENYIITRSLIDMIPQKITLNALDQTLTLECDIKKHLSSEDFEKIKAYLSEPLIYTWNKTSFK